MASCWPTVSTVPISRVGQVLESGSLGEVVGHDDAAHSYTLNVSAAAAQQKKKGFFGRMFGRRQEQFGRARRAPASHQVQVSINGSGTTASEVRAEGNAAARWRKVIDTLKSRLGG